MNDDTKDLVAKQIRGFRETYKVCPYYHMQIHMTFAKIEC